MNVEFRIKRDGRWTQWFEGNESNLAAQPLAWSDVKRVTVHMNRGQKTQWRLAK